MRFGLFLPAPGSNQAGWRKSQRQDSKTRRFAMKRNRILVLMSILLSIQGGCGESSWQSGDQVEAEVALVIALGMGAYASGEALVGLDQTSGTGDVDLSIDCEEGGTLEATGTVTRWGQMVALDITLIGCHEGGAVMDGTLHYTASSSSTGSVRTVMGVVTYSEPIAIDACAIDATEELHAAEQVITYRGTVCGRAIDRAYGPEGPR